MKRTRTLLVAALLLLGLPLLGVWLAGLPLSHYTEFPPLTQYRVPAPFCWTAVFVIAAIQVPLWIPVVALLLRFQVSGFRFHLFPRWGWIALAWTGTWWIIAWTRFPCFALIQHHTFTPLWLGYIASVNALTFARSGRCLMTHEPRRLAALFAASSFFWWFFEYLNRFVQNWYYLGIENFGRLEYFLFASLAFSTVLPAVMSTAELLDACVPAAALTRSRLRLLPLGRRGAWALLCVASLGLGGIGVRPDYLYPLLWLAPLLILTSLRALRGSPTLFAAAAQGDWRRLAILSLAALICGFFWELWNLHSLAKWIYLVPFVGVWKVFEMPLLGFAGYLPFGFECAVIADALTGGKPGTEDPP